MNSRTAATFNGPTTSEDPWDDDVLRDPYPFYAELRDHGSAVWLERYDMVAIPRFHAARDTLLDWRTFSSASGVGVDAETNENAPRGVLMSDPPKHGTLRRILDRQLSPRRVRAEANRIEKIANKLLAPVVARTGIDAVTDLSQPYIEAVIGEITGIPAAERHHMAQRSKKAFATFGPTGPRQRSGFATAVEIVAHATRVADRVCPGSRGAELVAHGQADAIINYTWPGIDTAVNALSSVLYLLARHPEQWELLRADPSLVPAATAEALRVLAPIRHFTRLATTSTAIGDVTIPAGTRVMIMYGSANRDERRFPEPDVFDITRQQGRHLAFGQGVHHCVGATLARREVDTMLHALLKQVRSIELLCDPVWTRNTVTYGPEVLPVKFVTT